MNDPQADFVYEFEGFELDPARRVLTRGDGTYVPITAKAFDALVCLAEHAGHVVTRQALAAALWPTTIVEDNNLSQTIAALRRALGDAQDEPRFVATVPRRGYQLVVAVRKRAAARAALANEAAAPAADIGTAGAVTLSAPATARTSAARRLLLGVAASGALAALAVFGATLLASRYAAENSPSRAAPRAQAAALGPHSPLPSSVAVLPFKDLSPNEDDAYFAAGMHEEILSRLAKIRGVNVIASTSVMRYANGTAPIGEIAADLNVAAIVEGSVRYSPDRVRVSVRLIDAATSSGVWSEEYDADPRDVFDIQADIAARIAAAIEPELAPTARAESRPPRTRSPRAYALYLRVLSLYRTHGGIGVGTPLAIRRTMLNYLDEASALDPNFAAALAWRAHLRMDSLTFDPIPAEGWRGVRTELVERIDADARRAVALDPTEATAYATLARLDLFRGRFADARATLDRALQINPNDLVVLHYSAMAAFLRDEHADAVRAARRAIELDPKNPAPHTPLAMALRALGNVDAAAKEYEAMIEAAPTASIGYVGLARTRTASGDPEQVLEPLRLAEQFLEDARNFRVDAACSYASVGAHADAERLIAEFERSVAGYHLDPGLMAMASLALGKHDRAREQVRAALADRGVGMDPMTLALIRQNTWSDPVLETPDWVALRSELVPVSR